jgi:hypothetical protein
VGLVIKALEERLGLIGRIIVCLIGVAWSVASVFAVPIIVRDEDALYLMPPTASSPYNADMFKSAWKI